METKKLYYEDSMRFDFTARVLECLQTPEGWQVLTDATCFYPEGGGQPWDLGVLGQRRVLAVREEEGRVLHLCDGPLEPGSAVRGLVDEKRRMDLMQQHTGEHMVSGVIHRRWGLHNVGFHMGAEVITVDFDGPLTREDLQQVEQEVNRWVWEDLPLRCWCPEPAELEKLSYRSKKRLPWPVRLVEIPGVDLCACCGVHTATTGRVGPVKILSCVKFHRGVRVELVCGARAMTLFSRVYEENRQVSQVFSAKPLETGAAAQRISQALTQEKYRVRQLRRELLRLRARTWGEAAPVVFDPELSPQELRELAEALGEVTGATAAVLSGGPENWELCLFSPRGAEQALADALRQRFGARGGGKGGFFQGRVCGSREVLEDFLRGFGRQNQ